MTNLLPSPTLKVLALALSVGTAGFLIVQAQKQANPAPPAPAPQPVEPGGQSTAPAEETPPTDVSDTWFLGSSKSALNPTVRPPLTPGDLDANGNPTTDALTPPVPQITTLGTSKSVTIQLPEVLKPEGPFLPTSKSLSPMELEKLMGKPAANPAANPKNDQ